MTARAGNDGGGNPATPTNTLHRFVEGAVPLHFPSGIPGFPGIEDGSLVRGSGPVMSLRVGPHSLPVVVPWDADPEFGYQFHDEAVSELGDPREWTVVCVVNLQRQGSARRSTINRFAPVVVNEWEGVAAQVVNRAGDYSTRDPFNMEAVNV